MTVIAWDGKILVTDGRCTTTDGRLVSDQHRKMHRVNIKDFGGECMIGLAGAADSIGPFLKHVQANGLVPMSHFKCDSTAEEAQFFLRGIAVNKKGQCFEFSSEGGWFEVTGPTSIGTGETVAQHYLLKGCDAVEAVIETCTTELTCGGTLLSYEWKTGKLTEIRP
jgi:hypothetical protein